MGWIEVSPPPRLPPADHAKLVEAYRQAIVELYQTYVPARLGNVDEFMRKYEGGEWHLYKSICL